MEVSPPAVPTPAAATNGASSSVSAFPTIEPERVVEHLAAVCQVALGATQEELEQPGNLLHKSRYSETVSRCTRFANDTQNVLYIQKDMAHSTVVEGGSDPSSTCPQETQPPPSPLLASISKESRSRLNFQTMCSRPSRLPCTRV